MKLSENFITIGLRITELYCAWQPTSTICRSLPAIPSKTILNDIQATAVLSVGLHDNEIIGPL